MKAIGFFFAIFLSMLAVFLVATGEVSRWFSGPARSPIELADIAGTEERRPDGQNLLEFDFYDVDAGRRSFSIRAYLSQSDFHVESRIDQIRELTLKDGTLEVPLADDPAHAAAGPAPENAAHLARKVVLQFRSALYTRGDPDADGKRDFVVLLREGKGVLDDGTEFFFDDLRFARAPQPAGGAAKDGTGFLLTSDKRASIRGKAIELSSPAGFQGILEGTGIDTFEFHPPVAALIDPRERSVLKLDPAVAIDRPAPPDGAEPATPAAGSPPDAPAGADNGGSARGERIAVTCQGPLTLRMGRREENGEGESRPAVTSIRFQKDVKLFTVEDGAAVDSLPAAEGSRLECQHLEFELERREDGLVPRRALATGIPGDPAEHAAGASPRVTIHIRREGGLPYTIHGERLEWVLRDADAAAGAGARASEAILSPRPTLHGEGIDLVAERAAFRLPENRLVLEEVRGTIRHEAGARKEPPKEKAGRPPIFPVNPPADPTAAAGERERGQRDTDAKARSSLPSVWDVKADEAEFHFAGAEEDAGRVPGGPAGSGEPDPGAATSKGGGAPRELSRLVARSRTAGGVEIRSRPEGRGPEAPESAGGPASVSPEPPFVVTGDLLTYVDGEKRATLEGSPARKPRFERGANWIEARRMSLHLEDGVAVFEEDVRGRLEDLKTARRAKAPTTSPGPGDPAPGQPGDTAAGTPEIEAIDVESSFLALRFEDLRDVSDLLARGAVDSPLRVTAHSAGDRWYRLVGPQLHWDQVAEVARLYGFPDAPAGGAGAGDGAASLPRIEYEGGDVRAGSIRFERKTWRATLAEGVIVKVFPSDGKGSTRPVEGPDGPPEVEITAGSAEIDFFPELKRRGAQSGSLEGLASVKSLRAHRAPPDPGSGAPGGLIQIRTPTFTGRTEELRWDSESRRLHFEGNGLQEIDVAREDFQGPITAREVVFDEERKLLILQGGVQGRLVQARVDARAEAAGASRAESREAPRAAVEPAALGSAPRQIVWHFATNVLEVQLEEMPRGGGFELVSVRARDRVHLRNDEHGLQLLGDDMTYEEATRKVHVFSPDGRPQTLLCDRSSAREEPPARENEAGPEEVHKVVSQEIWVLFQENPHAIAARGEPGEWLIASFHGDVIGSFHLPPQESERKTGDLGDTLKMVAERLTLYVDPSQSGGAGEAAAARRMIPWAVADGNVDFSSGSLRATADRALFEEPLGRLTLFGSPARLSRENKRVFEDPEIAIRRVAGDARFELVYRGPPRPRTASLPDAPPEGR